MYITQTKFINIHLLFTKELNLSHMKYFLVIHHLYIFCFMNLVRKSYIFKIIKCIGCYNKLKSPINR